MKTIHSLGLRFENNRLWILDQTKLPHEEIWLESETPEDMIDHIRTLRVRGAPLIGVAAALSLGLFAEKVKEEKAIHAAGAALRAARPTAVNLMMAIDRVLDSNNPLQEAIALFEEDIALCDAMANHGAALIADGDGILTHCNAGALATGGVGTALGVIIRAHEQGKRIHVFVDETRPLLQGARLTAWELARAGVPHTLICDNMSATVMREGRIQKIFVGADRIATNGDFANKIGTYAVAILAKHHGIPFYPVAPYTTIDFECPHGRAIPIEERDASEVRGEKGNPSSPVFNPAFDVTPVELVTALVLDRGVFRGNELSGLERLRKYPEKHLVKTFAANPNQRFETHPST